MREGNKEGGETKEHLSDMVGGRGGGIRISFIEASKAEFRIPTVVIYLLAEHPLPGGGAASIHPRSELRISSAQVRGPQPDTEHYATERAAFASRPVPVWRPAALPNVWGAGREAKRL